MQAIFVREAMGDSRSQGVMARLGIWLFSDSTIDDKEMNINDLFITKSMHHMLISKYCHNNIVSTHLIL